MKTPKQSIPKQRTAKQRIQDSVRREGRGMQYRPADEGPYDRIMGKDMMPEEDMLMKGKKPVQMAKGGTVKGKQK